MSALPPKTDIARPKVTTTHRQVTELLDSRNGAFGRHSARTARELDCAEPPILIWIKSPNLVIGFYGQLG
jgi:hypothetical protein